MIAVGEGYAQAIEHMLRQLKAARPELLVKKQGRWEGPMVIPDTGAIAIVFTSGKRGLVAMVSASPAADGMLYDMCEIRARFFRHTDAVLHVWPPVDEHVNDMATCLHLWCRLDGTRVVPDLRAVDPDGRRGV